MKVYADPMPDRAPEPSGEGGPERDPAARPLPIVSFIMSGGVGSRLWPLSREDNPKQFHNLAGDGSMLGKTLRRIKARPGAEGPVYVIAAERHAERVHADLASVDLAGGVPIFEPMGRNTAAAVAVATLRTLASHGDALALVVPSDHEIATNAQFWATVEAGAAAAQDGRIVVFGIPPSHPETGYGYIEAPAYAGLDGEPRPVRRFVEKPDLETAKTYLAAGSFFWNAGIFLFRARAMRDAFLAHQPEIWALAGTALDQATTDLSGLYLPQDVYARVPSDSIDYAIMERAEAITMVPARFRWSDLGSWQSLLEASSGDTHGNVTVGDVVAIDCEHSYLRSQGRLLTAIGLRNVAVVSTADATFVAPVTHSQHVKKIVEQLERSGRLETKYTPAADRVLRPGAFRERVAHWLFEETLPLWSTAGVDRRHGGFHEALAFDGTPVARPKRVRTIGRQIYAFAMAKERGWDGNADELIAHGVDFLERHGRSRRGGWVRTLNVDGSVADATEDAYDHSCVLLALAHAHATGNSQAFGLGEEVLGFIDTHLADRDGSGYLETPEGSAVRGSNAHMHLLEAFLAWYAVTGNATHLRRAMGVVDLFRTRFFDAESWTLGEFFAADWSPADGQQGEWTEPGHHFEWASLLVDFARAAGQPDWIRYARKLYASAVANGLNRSTGLAYAAVSRDGMPLSTVSRSWPQAEVIKAAIALDEAGGPDLKPEIEARVHRLFRWHIEPAPTGLWIDQIDERGRSVAADAPASIFYHLTCALNKYLDAAGSR